MIFTFSDSQQIQVSLNFIQTLICVRPLKRTKNHSSSLCFLFAQMIQLCYCNCVTSVKSRCCNEAGGKSIVLKSVRAVRCNVMTHRLKKKKKNTDRSTPTEHFECAPHAIYRQIHISQTYKDSSQYGTTPCVMYKLYESPTNFSQDKP